MSEEVVGQVPTVFSSKERAALVARALSEAARRARFSTKRRRSLTAGGLRARRGERLIRLLRIWTFIGIVAVPCLALRRLHLLRRVTAVRCRGRVSPFAAA